MVMKLEMKMKMFQANNYQGRRDKDIHVGGDAQTALCPQKQNALVQKFLESQSSDLEENILVENLLIVIDFESARGVMDKYSDHHLPIEAGG